MSGRIALISMLLLLSAFFSCSETSLFSLSRSEVARFKSSKSRFAKGVIDALSRPRHLLVSILLGNEVVNVAISILVAALIYEVIPGVSWQAKIVISVAIATPLIVIIGEVIPKNVGIRFASSLSAACAIFIYIFSYLLTPLRMLLLKLADRAISVFGGNPNDIRSMIMEEEFRGMVELGCDEGSLNEGEGELIHNVFEFADKTVEGVMTPKEAVFSLPLDADMASAMSQIRATKFSRIPVYDANADDIVGILHVRDLFSVLRRREVKKIRDVENIIRPVYFAPLSTTLEQLLREFQQMKVHMAVVVDEGHRPAGVVTMEDVFEALFKGE